MLKSLYSGVSGLQSHQIAMDVESNNIANVNTVGYKYSRANFADMLAQTNQIATAPEGESGGKNAIQVGLGGSVNSITRIHSQGSVQNTDKNTDVAIQGDGFFIVSGDAGKALKYTRSGDFKFDALGNFVDNNGFVVQGWTRDEETGKVDSTAPIKNIQIPPGLTTPANGTDNVILKANLNSGSTVSNFSAIRPLDQFHNAADLNRDGLLNDKDSLSGNPSYENNPWLFNTTPSTTNPNPDLINENDQLEKMFTDTETGKIIERGEDFDALVDASGRAFQLQAGDVGDKGQGVWMSFRSATLPSTAALPNAAGSPPVGGGMTIASGAIKITTSDGTAIDVPAITTGTSSSDLNNANAIAAAINSLREKTGVVATVTGGNGNARLTFTNDNSSAFKNINIQDESGFVFNGSALGVPISDSDSPAKKFRYTDSSVNQVGWNSQVTPTAAPVINDTAGTYPFPSSEVVINGVPLLAPQAAIPGTIASAVEYAQAINDAFAPYGGTIAPAFLGNEISATVNGGGVDILGNSVDVTVGFTGGIHDANAAGLNATVATELAALTNSPDTYYFKSTEDMREGMQQLLRNDRLLDLNASSRPGTGYGTAENTNATVSVTSEGKFSLENPGGGLERAVAATVTSIVDTVTTENVFFTQTMQGLAGTLPSGSSSSRNTLAVNVPVHSSSIDVFDSLGSKHTLKMDFRKKESGVESGSTWMVSISVPEPATLNPESGIGELATAIEGEIVFGDDGSLKNVDSTIANINFSANNGSKGDQAITINFGAIGGFDGVTSFDNVSTTSGISQDGYPGGDLLGIRIDQSGTLVGSFSNGRSFGLAQISMAKFANNEGLSVDGGNIYLQSANSGDPIIGAAASGGRGFIQSSALESSNVDLSRSLTQLIIIQRGFQANGKTITTSDQLLQALLGLKQ